MKQLLIFLLLLCSASASAQDVIVKKDGSTVVCRVVEITSTEIVYKKWSDLNGSNYVMDRSLASAINYENGKKVNLSEVTNLYKPHNQNDGVQQYNDIALLRLDSEARRPYVKKAKTLQIIGFAGGGAMIAAGLITAISGAANNGGLFDFEDDGESMWGLCLIGGGVVWTTSFLLVANTYKKRATSIDAYSLYQHDLKFSNGSSLSFGADMLHDRTLSSNTLGLGLRYNF